MKRSLAIFLVVVLSLFLVGCAGKPGPENTKKKEAVGTSSENTVAPTPEPTPTPNPEEKTPSEKTKYIANKNTKKFHYSHCSSVKTMKESNKWHFEGTRDELIAQGYAPCKICKP
ncbi:MAG: hypothetical protein GX900_03245 [Clostridiaceae bacterium]|nr:hypothetical protein [Clostridiaceae bacterium]